jgi:hypothetical protein
MLLLHVLIERGINARKGCLHKKWHSLPGDRLKAKAIDLAVGCRAIDPSVDYDG